MEFDWRVIFTIVVFSLASFSAAKAFKRLWKLLQLMKKEDLAGTWKARIELFVKNVLGQKKLFKDFWPGLQHALIFWGFLIITIGTAEHIVEGLFHGFSFSFLGPIYGPIIFLQEWAHPIVFAAVLYGFFRRLVLKPKRLATDWAHAKDAYLVLGLTGLLMLANMITFAAYIAMDTTHAIPEWRPVSQFLNGVLFSNASSAQLHFWSHLGWAIHLLTVAYFLHYIPNSKHLHVVAAGPNFLFARMDNKGTLSQIDFEDESVEQYGVAKLTDFTWKDALDTYSCTACGRCNEYCPTATTGKSLQPMKLVEDLKAHLFKVGDELLKNPQADISQSLVGNESGITTDTIWDCTSCRACVEACPVGIEHIDKIVDLRRNLVMMEGQMPAELETTMRNFENQSNPWGMPQDSRDEWCQSLNVPKMAEHPEAEYLFYVGCAGSFNDRNKKISTAVVKILQAAKIDFAILGKEELCNGETARRAGNEYLAKMMVDANIEVLQRYSVKKIITTCPHCFNTLKNEYPDFGFKAESVEHHTEFIQRLIEENKIDPSKSLGEQTSVVFHDSCYLGRYNDIFEAPRKTLKSLPGVELKEMPRKRETGLCCGAGGARMWMEETEGKRINVERTEEALAQKPKIVASACPYCQVMMEDGVKEKDREADVFVKDIAELVADSLENTDRAGKV